MLLKQEESNPNFWRVGGSVIDLNNPTERDLSKIKALLERQKGAVIQAEEILSKTKSKLSILEFLERKVSSTMNKWKVVNAEGVTFDKLESVESALDFIKNNPGFKFENEELNKEYKIKTKKTVKKKQHA